MQKRIENPEALARIVEGLRSQGKIVVLALAAFETIRAADVRALQDARSRGDYLILGVNPKWPSGTKGKKSAGPKVPARDRAEVLAALRVVDYVTIFEDPTAEKMLRLLRPAFLLHGAPSVERTPLERGLVQELGISLLGSGEGRRAAAGGSRRLLTSRKSR